MEKKPILFEGACVFSFLGSSIGVVAMLLSAVFFQYVSQKIVMLTNYTAADSLSPLYFVLLMASYSLSLVGVIKLYRMQRTGLYFYLLAQAMIFIIPVLVLGSNALSVVNVIFTILFPAVYIFYYRHLS
ncbi:MAG TPA: hypothetical protein VFG54_20420 [Prolixibacteraceae bacterium]|nr:hypothetical protein [Prolixibacteraceae bacterium]